MSRPPWRSMQVEASGAKDHMTMVEPMQPEGAADARASEPTTAAPARARPLTKCLLRNEADGNGPCPTCGDGPCPAPPPDQAIVQQTGGRSAPERPDGRCRVRDGLGAPGKPHRCLTCHTGPCRHVRLSHPDGTRARTPLDTRHMPTVVADALQVMVRDAEHHEARAYSIRAAIDTVQALFKDDPS